jgi:methylated-DNA-[protein]-cysteine S-methyltransferase
MKYIEIQEFKTPYGELLIAGFRNKLCMCDWKWRKMRKRIDTRIKEALDAEFVEAECDVISNTKNQLNEYFDKKRIKFDLPLLIIGTDFQKSVWNELINIPYGKTESYSGLSQKMNKPDSIRAIASANGANAISIIVPCHRIIGSNGDLVGYAGGLLAKKKLLELELGHTMNNEIDFYHESKI